MQYPEVITTMTGELNPKDMTRNVTILILLNDSGYIVIPLKG